MAVKYREHIRDYRGNVLIVLPGSDLHASFIFMHRPVTNTHDVRKSKLNSLVITMSPMLSVTATQHDPQIISPHIDLTLEPVLSILALGDLDSIYPVQL